MLYFFILYIFGENNKTRDDDGNLITGGRGVAKEERDWKKNAAYMNVPFSTRLDNIRWTIKTSAFCGFLFPY